MTLISLNDVNMTWGQRHALVDANLDINRGDFLAITGPNGGGKTTLLRIILKLLKPTSGSVAYFNAQGQPTDRLAIGYLPQKNMIDSRFPITVSEVIALGLPKHNGENQESRTKRVAEVVAMVGLEEKAASSVGDLSGGQLQRALLGRALISRPEVLVLDEPLSYVDKRFEHRIYDIIRRVHNEGTTIILVSHEVTTIASMANRHIIVDRHLESCHSAHHFIHYSSSPCCDHPHCGQPDRTQIQNQK